MTAATPIRFPAEPIPFLRELNRAAKRVSNRLRRYEHEQSVMTLNEHGRTLDLRRATRRLMEAQAVLKAFEQELDRRYQQATKEAAEDRPQAFHALQAAQRYVTPRRRQWVHVDDDGFYKTGRSIRGIPEVRGVPCQK